MKKTTLILFSLVSIFSACKHAPITPDFDYFNDATNQKILEYWEGYETPIHNVITITLGQDTIWNKRVSWEAHINNDPRLLDSITVENGFWFPLPKHFGSGATSSSLSKDYDQIVPFQIRSKTPQNEVISGQVTVPKSTPILATDLGNNTFKINWVAQKKGDRVLIFIASLYAYTPYFDGSFAVETEDDGEYTIPSTVFEKIKNVHYQLSIDGRTEPLKVSLLRSNPKRKTVIRQPSTGIDYTVYGGSPDVTKIDVVKIK
jgi:hypothetical protein